LSRYLFSVDLEEDGSGRLPELTGRYLDFLGRHDARATFFVVGEVARSDPDLIRRIAGEGHEIGCHSDAHLPLDRQDPGSFRDDLRRNLDALAAAGATSIRGYRAPFFSLTAATAWAYPTLAELGFAYSSSVLPAPSPLYGWPGFGAEPRRMGGVLELPITRLPWRLLPVPMGGGVYFRILPRRLLRRAFELARRRRTTVLGYFHPYDIDTEAKRGTFRGHGAASPINWLLHANRRDVFGRLEAILASGFTLETYAAFAAGEGRDG
jgi:peptidoglycan-N-acetylglucosamine deacetylase